MRRRLPAIGNGLVVVALLLCCGSTAATHHAPTIAQALDSYAAGNYEAAELVATSESEFLQLRTALQRLVPTWIAAEGADQGAKRRQVSGAFVLEWLFANEEHWRTDSRGSRPTAYWAAGPYQFDRQGISEVASDIPEAVERTWQVLQPSQASSFDRAWAFAVVTLLWDAGSFDFYLFYAPEQPTNLKAFWENRYGVPLGFLARVRSRFPDDPRLALRAAIGYSTAIHQELANRIGQHHEVPYAQAIETIRRGRALDEAQRVDSKDVDLGIADRRLLSESDGLSILDRVAKSLVPFRSVPLVRADADLELGMIAICFAQHDDARKLFDELEQSQPTPCQAYHARFLRGRVDEEDGRIEDAERDYRQALAIIPSAQSSVSSLASLLSLHDRQSDAAALLQQELTQPIQDDPWGWVLSAPCPQWPEAIAAVRAALK